jgi:hypothetical protein
VLRGRKAVPVMRTLSINVSADDLVTIQAIIARVPLATRHAVARAAFRSGINQMVRDADYALDVLVREAEHRHESEGGAS